MAGVSAGASGASQAADDACELVKGTRREADRAGMGSLLMTLAGVASWHWINAR
ncbi:hypothetical protein PSAC2689_80122 [Paraburkholderia sacchari]